MKKINPILFLIVVVAIFVRFIFINSAPPSLNWDEISHGYNAYSILKTGKDEWGKFMPLIFRAYGDYKLPLYIYLTAISELFFGLSTFSVRLISAISGVGSTIVGYFLVKSLFNSETEDQEEKNKLENTSLLTALLIAVEPWTLFIGRAAFEANLGLFMFLLGLLFFQKFLKEKKYVLLSITFFGFSVWSYNSYRIFTPLIMFVLFLLNRKEMVSFFQKQKNVFVKSVLVLLLLFMPMFIQLLSSSGSARYSKVSIIDEGAINKIQEDRGNYQKKYPDFVARLMSNKLTYFAKSFSSNYLSYFSFNYLFTKGGSQYQFSVPGSGLLYIINLPFILIGLFFVVKQIKSSQSKFILSWILIAPIVASITREAPHVLRSVTILPLPMILTSIGFFEVLNYVTKKFKVKAFKVIINALYLILIFVLLQSYLAKYFGKYTVSYSQSWQYGYKEVANYIAKNSDNYAKIVMTKKYGEPHEFLLFYLKYNPASYQKDKNLNRFYQSGWYWVDGFDKFYFVNDWQIPTEGDKFVQESKKVVDCRQAKCLLITSPGNFPTGWSKIETIKFLDGSIAFELYEN